MMSLIPGTLALDGSPLPPVEPWEDGLRTGGAPGTLEFWYFDTVMDDGSTAGFNFFTRPPTELAGPLKPRVSINIARPDQRRTREVIDYRADEFSAARDHCDVHIGPNRASGTLVDGFGRYEINLTGKETAANLVFRGEVPAWRPGTRDGELKPGITFAWLPFIPYGSVEGTLTYDGAVHRVRGTGYHDHNWMNVDMTKIVDHWYWGRAYTKKYRLVFVQVFGRPEALGPAPISALLVARDTSILLGDFGQGIPLTLREADFATGPGDRSYPKALDFDWAGAQGRVYLALREPKFIEWFPVGAGWYYRWKSELELTVDLDGTHVVDRGIAIYERLLLH
ncbi:MAG TPA: hypothetical protein VMG98_08530 [Verrucomicrobiae bacterium]|nr:hypothetical protein [Verrucomicrobiae bacterium]